MTAVLDPPVTARAEDQEVDAGASHLLGRLAVLEERVRAAVARRRAVDPDPDDGFRGLYLADHHVDALLAGGVGVRDGPDPAGDLLAEVEAAAGPSRLSALAVAAGLTPLDVDLLIAALAPDLDARLEKLYGYLHDDVTQKRATTGLALELAGARPTDPRARARLDPGAPLVRLGLVSVEPSGTSLRRVLRVPDRVTAHLLGDDGPEPALADLLVEVRPGEDVLAWGDAPSLGRAVAGGSWLVHLHSEPGSAPRELAAAGLAAAGLGAVTLDLRRLAEVDLATVAETARLAGREALLRGAGIVAGPIEVLTAGGPSASDDAATSSGAAALRVLAELAVPTVLHGTHTWDPLWSRDVALLATAPALPPERRAQLWAQGLDGATVEGFDAAGVTRQFRLGPEGLGRAAAGARQQAALAGGLVAAPHLLAAARAQNAVGLERLARRVTPAVGWTDLVLPPVVVLQLQELTARARHREQVLGSWRMRPGGGRGIGITGLFAGESGTGKTLAAEVVAGSLGLDLYTVDLATVVDKYIGETEKNLEKIFSQADGVNGVLLFDEADALFGKRSEVKDARDRYANIEVAYLLQRMETFDGLALLSTNLRTNLDDAFSRRLDAVVDFPEPDAEHRGKLWDLCLGVEMPRSDDIDLAWLADRFALAGGHIRSICVTAAYLSADAGRPVCMADLVRGTQQEYRKLGRLVLDSEFGVRP